VRALHVIDNLNLGGSQNLAWRTWQGLQCAGVDIGVCVLCDSPREQAWPWLPDKVFRLGCHGDYRQPGSLSAWSRRLEGVVEDFRPDLLHSWLWLSDVVTAAAACRRRVPHLVQVVDRRTWQESRQWKHVYRRWITRRRFRRAGSRFLAVSKAAADYAIATLALPPGRVGVAYNSIDVEQFAAAADSPAWIDPDKPLVLGMAARMEPEKGHRVLLEAVHILRRGGIPVSLQIAGDGSERAELQRITASYRLGGDVNFRGVVECIRTFLQGIDVFVVPSIDSEGLPTTILEAMAAGRVVIATDVGGATEAITDRENGLIVPTGSPEALAAAIEHLATQRPLGAALAQCARLRVKAQFDMPRMMDQILAAYGTLVAPGVSPHAVIRSGMPERERHT